MGTERRGLFYGWYIVAACFLLCMLFAGAGFYSFSIFIRPLEAQFGWSRGAIAMTMSIYLVVSGLAGLPIGKFIGRFGPKAVMTVCALGSGACFLMVSLTFSLWYFYLVYGVLAVMVCGIGVIPVSSLMTNWFSRLRGTATGITMVGVSTGGLVLAPLVGMITARFGWNMAFVVIGLAVWIIALPTVRLVIREHPREMGLLPDGRTGAEAPADEHFDGDPPPAAEGRPADEVFRTRRFWFIFASFFLASLSQMGILQHQVPMLMELAGTTEATAAAALGLTAGVGGAGKICFGRISDTWPFRSVVALCFGLQAAAVGMLLFFEFPAMVWIYTAVFGFSMGGIIVLMPLVVGHYWGIVSYGVLLGAIWIANHLGGAIGTYINGLAYDFTASYRFPLYLFLAAYVLSVIVFFLAGKARRL